jgi:hypothetical protein
MEPSTKLHRILIVFLLVWMTLAGLYLAWYDSPTTDEDIHVATGYLDLTRHDFRFDPEHSPLFKEITALPILLVHPHLPPDDAKLWAAGKPTFYDSWKEARQWSDEWFYKSGNNPSELIFLGRLPGVAIFVGLGWLAYCLALRWFNRRVAIWTLFFTAFNPILLGYGHLANDDVAVVFGILLCLGALWKYIQEQTARRAVLVGLTFVAATGTKYTGLGLVFVLAAVALYLAWSRRTWKLTLWHVLVVVGVFWAGIWTLYDFQSPLTIDPHLYADLIRAGAHTTLTANQVTKLAQILRYTLPSPFLKGLVLNEIATKYGRGAWVLGRHYWPGVWFYFPIVFFLKTQVVVMPVFLAGLFLSLRRQAFQRLREPGYLILTISLVVFSVLAMINKLDLGVRHIATICAFLSFFLALCVERLRRIECRWLPAAIAALYVIPLLAQWPNIISFTSELIQPYDQGWRYLNDSNIDWGQQSRQIVALAQQRWPGQTIAANYEWNPYVLGYYGLRTIDFTPQVPPTGVPILVTANQLSMP